MVEIQINNVQNETLRKLNWHEIGLFGLNNYGVYTYHGQLKTRKQGFKREVVSDWQTNFLGMGCRIEFVKIEQTDTDTNYAMRVYDVERETYITAVNVLLGCDFFK